MHLESEYLLPNLERATDTPRFSRVQMPVATWNLPSYYTSFGMVHGITHSPCMHRELAITEQLNINFSATLWSTDWAERCHVGVTNPSSLVPMHAYNVACTAVSCSHFLLLDYPSLLYLTELDPFCSAAMITGRISTGCRMERIWLVRLLSDYIHLQIQYTMCCGQTHNYVKHALETFLRKKSKQYN